MKKEESTQVRISAPKLQTLSLKIKGTAPYVQLRFSEKAMNAMSEKMKAGSTSKGKKVRTARDFDDDFIQSMHISEDKWHGIPAAAFRNAMISACRLVGFKMTLAKLSVFVVHDGIDSVDGVPLIKINGTPEPLRMAVRNSTGVADLRVRAKFWPWQSVVKITFDAEQFTQTDIVNLFNRVGQQVGIGEGRPDSKTSAGMGWGTFEIVN